MLLLVVVVVCCLLFVVCCLLFVFVCCLLIVVYYLLFVVCGLLLVCCLLFVACCLLFVVCVRSLTFVRCSLLPYGLLFSKRHGFSARAGSTEVILALDLLCCYAFVVLFVCAFLNGCC